MCRWRDAILGAGQGGHYRSLHAYLIFLKVGEISHRQRQLGARWRFSSTVSALDVLHGELTPSGRPAQRSLSTHHYYKHRFSVSSSTCLPIISHLSCSRYYADLGATAACPHTLTFFAVARSPTPRASEPFPHLHLARGHFPHRQPRTRRLFPTRQTDQEKQTKTKTPSADAAERKTQPRRTTRLVPSPLRPRGPVPAQFHSADVSAQARRRACPCRSALQLAQKGRPQLFVFFSGGGAQLAAAGASSPRRSCSPRRTVWCGLGCRRIKKKKEGNCTARARFLLGGGRDAENRGNSIKSAVWGGNGDKGSGCEKWGPYYKAR